MKYLDEDEPMDLSGRSGKSAKSKSSRSGGTASSSPDVSYTDAYGGRSLSHPPTTAYHSQGSEDSYPEKLISRRSSNESGRNIRKKLKYESKYGYYGYDGKEGGEDLLRGSITTEATGATEATDKMGNVKNPGQNPGKSNHSSSIYRSGRKSQRGSEYEDDTIVTEAKTLTAPKTEKTSSMSSSSTGSRRRRQERERMLARGSGGLDDSIEENRAADYSMPRAQRVSSTSSSSTGSRLERQRASRASGALGSSIEEDSAPGLSVAEQTSSKGSSSTGSRRRRQERERLEYERQRASRASGGLDSSIEEDSVPIISFTNQTSSKGSSSTGSRRRRQERERLERERQRARVAAAAAAGGQAGADILDGSLNDGRISPVFEGVEVGGENFNLELQAGASTTDHSYRSGDYSRGERSRDYSRGDHSRPEYSGGGGRANRKKNYEQMDWPVPQDHFMDDPQRTTSSASGSSSHHSGGVGGTAVLHIDDVANAQSNMFALAQQQAQLGQQQAPQPTGPRKAVLHACDDKGRCLFHPHIILRKKALFGGWKDVLPACPECESEDIAGGGSVVEGGDASVADKSGTSIGSALRRASIAEEEEEEDESYESTSGEDDEDSDVEVDDESDADSSSSSSGEGSSGSSSPGESSYSSEEDEEDEGDETVVSEQPASVDQSERSLPPMPNRKQMEQGAKAIAGRARMINKLAGEVASGAGSKIKKLNKLNQDKEDYISSYISSGVPSRPTKKKSKAKEAQQLKDYDSFFDRPAGGGKQKDIRRTSVSNDVEPEDEVTLPPSLAPDESVDASTDQASAHTQQSKKVLKGVSKGVSKFIGKSKNKIQAKAAEAKAAAARPQQGQAGASQPPPHQSRGAAHHTKARKDNFGEHSVNNSHLSSNLVLGRRSSAGTEDDRRKGASSRSKHRQRHSIHTMEGRGHRKRGKHRSRMEPKGNSLFINEGRVRNTGSFTVGAAKGQQQASSTMDNSMGSFPAHAQQMDVDADESPEEESSSQRLLKDASYQWDRIPLSELDMAAKKSTQESAIDEGDGESSVEDSSSQRLLKDASYQWDRVPLPETNMARINDESDEDESDDDDSSDDESGSSSEVEDVRDRQGQKRQQEEKLQNPSPQQDELMRNSLESLNMDDEVITSSNRMVSTSSASTGGESKSHTSGDLGLLSMEDLLQSIQKDISMGSAIRPDRAPGSSSRGSTSLSSHSHENKDRTREENVSIDEMGHMFDPEKEKELEAARRSFEGPKTDGAKEEGEKPKPDSVPAPPTHSAEPPPSDAPKALPLMGNYGGLQIDLSALQASKPTMKIKGSNDDGQDAAASSGELKIDLRSLQASKSINSQEKMEGEASEGAISRSQQPEESKDPLVDESIKTFETTNLPFTGQFGESGMYTGSVNEQYEPHGKGTMVYDNGQILKGYWNGGELVRESQEYSDEEDDGEDDDEEEDLSSSMANVSSKPRDRSRSRSRSLDRRAAPQPPPPPPPPKTPSPPPPEYNVGDHGKHRDMILDKEEAMGIIQQLKFGDGAFIRRSDGKWTYAKVKSFEETSEGKSSIRFIVNNRNSSKSYAKKYWGTHVRPVKGTKIAEPEKEKGDRGSSADNREGRAKRRETVGETGADRSSDDAGEAPDGEDNRGHSCPPTTQSRLTFDWGMAPQPVRHGRSRSRSRHRAVSFSRERQLTSIAESDIEDEDEDEDGPVVKGGLGALSQRKYELKGVDP